MQENKIHQRERERERERAFLCGKTMHRMGEKMTNL